MQTIEIRAAFDIQCVASVTILHKINYKDCARHNVPLSIDIIAGDGLGSFHCLLIDNLFIDQFVSFMVTECKGPELFNIVLKDHLEARCKSSGHVRDKEAD